MSKVLSVDLTDTLMAYDSNLETHLPSGERHSTYYFRVPSAWASLPQPDLDSHALAVMQKIYDAFNDHFRQVEPNDISYLKGSTRCLLPHIDRRRRTNPTMANRWQPRSLGMDALRKRHGRRNLH